MQSERTTDGILLNIVKRDTMIFQHCGVTELVESSYAEASVETLDAISGSECAEDSNDVSSVDHADFVTSQPSLADY